MKTNVIATMALGALLLSATSGFSSTGIFGTGVLLSSTIGGISTFKLYEMTLIGDSRLAPSVPGAGGVSLGAPTLVSGSAWATGGGPSLGTFTNGLDTLKLNGGEDLTFKNGGSDITGTQVFYQVDGGGFNQISLAFNQDNVNGTGGDQRWYYDGANVNLLTGLSLGTHTLNVYFRDDSSTTSGGHDFISNLGANYNATFTIVAAPEPTTTLLVASGLGMFCLLRRRR